MGIGNSPQISNYEPPVISRRFDTGRPRSEPEARAETPSAPGSRLPAEHAAADAANPLSALFDSGYKPAQAIRSAARPVNDQSALGRFVDVIA